MLANKITLHLTIVPGGLVKKALTNTWTTQCIPTVGSLVCLPFLDNNGNRDGAVYLRVLNVIYYPCDPRPQNPRELDELRGVKIHIELDGRDVRGCMNLEKIPKTADKLGLGQWSELDQYDPVS